MAIRDEATLLTRRFQSPLVYNDTAIGAGESVWLRRANGCNCLADSIDGTPPILLARKATNCGDTLWRLCAPDGVQPRRIRSDGGAKRLHRSIYSASCDLPRGSDVRSGQRFVRHPAG